jgi:hypothetical protein
MSSEYPDRRAGSLDEDPEAATGIYTKAAEDYLELNRVYLKDMNIK